MSPELLIAKLTQKIGNLQMGGGHSPDEITQLDVAHALAGLPKGASDLVWYVYVLDDSARSGLYASLMIEALDRKLITRDGMAPGLCHAAIWDCYTPHLCAYCGGGGVRINQHPCDHCDGGRVTITDKDRARMADMEPHAFLAKKNVFAKLIRILQWWEAEAFAHLLDRTGT